MKLKSKKAVAKNPKPKMPSKSIKVNAAKKTIVKKDEKKVEKIIKLDPKIKGEAKLVTKVKPAVHQRVQTTEGWRRSMLKNSMRKSA